MPEDGNRRSAYPGGAVELFERYGATVFRRCRALLGSDELAHDAVQEVFLRALGQASAFRGEANVLTWLYSIATLYCLQLLRNRTRAAAKLALVARTVSPASSPSLDERLDLEGLLRAEPPLVQQMVVLRFVDEMTVTEVAQVLGLSRKTVTQRLRRFLEQTRARFSLEPPDTESRP